MITLEGLLARDRWLVVGGLLLVSLLAWGYILAGAGMETPSGQMSAMTMPMAWTPGYAVLVFLMWWIMMVAMMLPSAAPHVMLFSKVERAQRRQGRSFASAGVFAAGYLLVWGFFSLVATSAQWGLEASALLGPMMESVSLPLSAGILIAAGLWQFTPLKQACLRHCRSPLHFLTHGFRTGTWGALRMGAEHGLFCLGCCWFLMALLFYGGVMNLYWIAGLALYVLLEKLAPAGPWIGRIAGGLLVVSGLWLLAGV